MNAIVNLGNQLAAMDERFGYVFGIGPLHADNLARIETHGSLTDHSRHTMVVEYQRILAPVGIDHAVGFDFFIGVHAHVGERKAQRGQLHLTKLVAQLVCTACKSHQVGVAGAVDIGMK